MRELDPNVEERNYAKQPLTRAEIEGLLDVVGSVGAALNSRHEVAKERGWKATPPDRDAFVSAALADNNLLRRPIVVSGRRAIVGYDEEALRELLG